MSRLALLAAVAALAACGQRITPSEYSADGFEDVDHGDPGETAVANAVRALPFKHVEWEYKFNDKPISRVTLEGDQLFLETPDHRVIAMDRFNGRTQWIFKVDTHTALDWPPIVAEGVPEEIRSLETDLRLVNRQIDDKLKEQGVGKETQALQKKRAEIRERLRVAAFGDNAYFISRQVLYCLDRISGGLRWTRRLGFVPSARPFAIRNYVFVPAADLSRVWVLDVERKGLEVTFYKADITTVNNQILNRPVYSAPSLFFVCHDGKVYSYNVDNGNLNWTYATERELMADPTIYIYRHGSGDAKAPAAAAPALKPEGDAGGAMAAPAMNAGMDAPPQDGMGARPKAVATTRFLFAGGVDNAFYALDADAGALVWKYECGAMIKSPAVAKDATVYARTEDGALHAFEVMPVHRDAKGQSLGVKRNGRLRWKIPLGERFLVKGKDRVYLVGPRRELWSVKEATGEVLGRYNTDLLPFLVTNTVDDYVYVANGAGYVYCLRESKQAY